jgi:hypothetical protein
MFLLYHYEGYNICEMYFTNVMSTTCILQHAVVCWVTTSKLAIVVEYFPIALWYLFFFKDGLSEN